MCTIGLGDMAPARVTRVTRVGSDSSAFPKRNSLTLPTRCASGIAASQIWKFLWLIDDPTVLIFIVQLLAAFPKLSEACSSPELESRRCVDRGGRLERYNGESEINRGLCRRYVPSGIGLFGGTSLRHSVYSESRISGENKAIALANKVVLAHRGCDRLPLQFRSLTSRRQMAPASPGR
jgi:hypothetical protein